MKLYIMHTDFLPDPVNHEEWKTCLPAGRWEKAAGYSRPASRITAAAAGWLLCYGFFKAGIPLLPDSIRYGSHGKPLHDGWYFNLSHSGEYVILAVGDEEIGCDIQKIRPCKEKTVQKVCSREEQGFIFSADGPERDERFTTIWARKESYLKKTGEGLTADLRRHSFLSDKGFVRIHYEDYIIALCTDEIGEGDQSVPVEFVDESVLRLCGYGG